MGTRLLLFLLFIQSLAFSRVDSLVTTATTNKTLYAPDDTLWVKIVVENHSPADNSLCLADPCYPIACIDTGYALCSVTGFACPQVVTCHTVRADSFRTFATWPIHFTDLSPGIHTVTVTLGAIGGGYPPIDLPFTVDGHLRVTYKFAKGWNLLSIPASLPNANVNELFPTANSPAYMYTNGAYQPAAALAPGNGYWLRCASAATVAVTLPTVEISDTIPVVEGWNLIGSISYPVAVAEIASDPPNLVTSKFFYSYDMRYFNVSTLQPGTAFWVKCAQAGNLILAGTAGSNEASASARIRIVENGEMPPSPPESSSDGNRLPVEFALSQCHPNPFNPSTSIGYSVPAASHVTISVYNLLGQHLATLVDEEKPAGEYVVEWDAGTLSSGVYFYKMSAGPFTGMKRMVLMR